MGSCPLNAPVCVSPERGRPHASTRTPRSGSGHGSSTALRASGPVQVLPAALVPSFLPRLCFFLVQGPSQGHTLRVVAVSLWTLAGRGTASPGDCCSCRRLKEGASFCRRCAAWTWLLFPRDRTQVTSSGGTWGYVTSVRATPGDLDSISGHVGVLQLPHLEVPFSLCN